MRWCLSKTPILLEGLASGRATSCKRLLQLFILLGKNNNIFETVHLKDHGMIETNRLKITYFIYLEVIFSQTI